MALRRIASAAGTMIIAIIVALAVPVSQLRTISIVKACCCPDPAQCHCPDHKPDHGGQPAMRACHSTQQVTIAPQLPSFTPPVIAIVATSQRVAIAPGTPLRSPHVSPLLARPDAPS